MVTIFENLPTSAGWSYFKLMTLALALKYERMQLLQEDKHLWLHKYRHLASLQIQRSLLQS